MRNTSGANALFQRFRQLVGAGRSVAALNALESGDNLVDLAADDEPGDALRIARAAATLRAGK